jgi:hypothetical protein
LDLRLDGGFQTAKNSTRSAGMKLDRVLMQAQHMVSGTSTHSTQRAHTGGVHLVSLNFKVPFGFRQRLKIIAANRAMTMTELVVLAVEKFVAERDSEHGSVTEHSALVTNADSQKQR